jgi:hypothetical protein
MNFEVPANPFLIQCHLLRSRSTQKAAVTPPKRAATTAIVFRSVACAGLLSMSVLQFRVADSPSPLQEFIRARQSALSDSQRAQFFLRLGGWLPTFHLTHYLLKFARSDWTATAIFSSGGSSSHSYLQIAARFHTGCIAPAFAKARAIVPASFADRKFLRIDHDSLSHLASVDFKLSAYREIDYPQEVHADQVHSRISVIVREGIWRRRTPSRE